MATTKNPPQAAAKLSKAAVVERALALADELGLEALTIRRLAQELGVTPMALYWHFRSKEELLAALGDRVWAEIDVDVDPAADWPDQLRGVLESLVADAARAPRASQLLLAGEKLHCEASIVGHRDGPGRAAARRVRPRAGQRDRPQRACGPADAGDERAGLPPAGTRRSGPRRCGRTGSGWRCCRPDRFPRVVEAAGPLTACDDPDFHYQFGHRPVHRGRRRRLGEPAAPPASAGS